MSLISGAIKVGEQVLRPGEALADGKIVDTDIQQDIAWKNGDFNFNGMDVRVIMRQLSRWYNVDVRYEGDIHQRTFQGKLRKNLTLLQMIDRPRVMHINVRLEGRTLLVH